MEAREECIRQVRKNDAEEQVIAAKEPDVYLPSQEFLNEMATLIQNLRQLSIHVVE